MARILIFIGLLALLLFVLAAVSLLLVWLYSLVLFGIKREERQFDTESEAYNKVVEGIKKSKENKQETKEDEE